MTQMRLICADLQNQRYQCAIDLNLERVETYKISMICLLYTSDAADERSSVDLGGRRIIKKKNKKKTEEKKKKKKTKKKKQP